jgi:hypothetical protein
MELVSSAETSTPDWRREFGYIEDIGDGRGYTCGLIGFGSGTVDLPGETPRPSSTRPGREGPARSRRVRRRDAGHVTDPRRSGTGSEGRGDDCRVLVLWQPKPWSRP